MRHGNAIRSNLFPPAPHPHLTRLCQAMSSGFFEAACVKATGMFWSDKVSLTLDFKPGSSDLTHETAKWLRLKDGATA